jgi:hypothetical protein
MNAERMMWQGQRSEAESRRRELQGEIAATVRAMRMELNPMLDPLQLAADDIHRAAARLVALQTELRDTEIRIARLTELLGN